MTENNRQQQQQQNNNNNNKKKHPKTQNDNKNLWCLISLLHQTSYPVVEAKTCSSPAEERDRSAQE